VRKEEGGEEELTVPPKVRVYLLFLHVEGGKKGVEIFRHCRSGFRGWANRAGRDSAVRRREEDRYDMLGK